MKKPRGNGVSNTDETIIARRRIMDDDAVRKYISDDLPEPEVVEIDDNEFKINSWKSRKTVGYALLAVADFIEKGIQKGRINRWPIRRTPAARRGAASKAVRLLGLDGIVEVKQKNGSIYLIRIEEVA